MCENRFYVKLLGKFEVKLGKDVLYLGRSRNSRNMRLLEILFTFHEEGIPRATLMDYLFGEEEVSDKSNSLRVYLHRLRKGLQKAGMVQKDWLRLKDGVYRWDPSIAIETDVSRFLQCISLAEREQEKHKKTGMLMAACYLYKGEFLEEAGAEQWVITRGIKYKQHYEEAMCELISLLREKKDYSSMVRVSRHASKIYPYDEWQILELEGLLSMNRTEEAIDLYRQTMDKYHNDLGIEIPKAMTDKIKSLNAPMENISYVIREIKDKLQEKTPLRGGIYLPLPSFIDTFRLMARITESRAEETCLMVCGLEEIPQQIIEDSKKRKKISDILGETIRISLGRGDGYTNYRDGQFLLLLSGAGEEQCECVFHKIQDTFHRKCKTWSGSLSYYATEVEKIL